MATAKNKPLRSKKSAPLDTDTILAALRLLAAQLHLIGDVITTAELALHGQNADFDAIIAMTLRRCAADPVYAARYDVEQLAMRLSAGT